MVVVVCLQMKQWVGMQEEVGRKTARTVGQLVGYTEYESSVVE